MKRLLVAGLLASLLIGTSYAGDHSSKKKQPELSKCTTMAFLGVIKGTEDRKVGIRDNDGSNIARKVCPECNLTERVDLIICFEDAYERTYYNRY